MPALRVDIYENRLLVLTHTAYGRTRKQAEAIIRVHSKYDSFLRAALTTGIFKGIALRTVVRWDR
jgi:hypothetical protein